MFENVDGRTDDGRTTTDGRTTDDGATGILIAHLGAFGSGELIKLQCVTARLSHQLTLEWMLSVLPSCLPVTVGVAPEHLTD